MMKMGILAELYTMNRQYDKANEWYRKAFALVPNFGLYRKRVINTGPVRFHCIFPYCAR